MNKAIKARNLIVTILKILLPVYSIILVCFFNIMPVTFMMNLLNIKGKSNITPAIEVTATTVILSAIVSLIFNKISFKNSFLVQAYDNFMDDELTLPLGMYESEYLNQKYKLYIKVESKYSSLFMRKFMESRDCLVLRVCLPNWVSYEIENKDDLGEDVVTEKSNQIVDINISKYMGDVCAQKEISFPIILELMSNSLETRIGGQVIAKYYLVKKDGTYLKYIRLFLELYSL
ncbi:hypothetical protein [Clostridium autoethanogenum]|uniref:Uncharacterized protein n=1 Tax=Clostridium autoethanogenum DSM 10061 TaxID=1341692 RepID=A0ABN4BFR4_9CLOT|nr:hypothetical protein [Clostridium autoethanogenum]AGY76383.1 hypothetical protein CAETHG_2170 [Clostridium autoethanogenum DSM 10061]